MDTALPQKLPFILDSNLAKANCTENQVCSSCDIVVLDPGIKKCILIQFYSSTSLSHSRPDPHGLVRSIFLAHPPSTSSRTD